MPNIRKRLVGPSLVATGPTTVYTVPALTKTHVRCVIVNNPTASAATFTITIGADAAGTRVMVYSVSANTPDIKYPELILDAAEIITVSAGTNNVLVVTIDGMEIVLG